MKFEFDVVFKMYVIHGGEVQRIVISVILFYSNKYSSGNTTCALVSPGNNLDNNFLTTQGMGVTLCKEPIYMCWLIPDLAVHEPWTVKRINLSNCVHPAVCFGCNWSKNLWYQFKISGEIPPQRCSGVSDSHCLAASGHWILLLVQAVTVYVQTKMI